MKVILTILALLSITSHAIARSGARGGGHVVQIGNKYKLYEEVTEAKCDWLSGKEILEENPYIVQFFKKLANLDWYLAFELKREAEYLAWCKTGKLYFHEPKDRDSVVQQVDTSSLEQGAYRYNSNVYLDQNIYDNMYERSRVYLIIHEVLHSYLKMPYEEEVNMRYLQLISLDSTMRKVDLGQITTREKLHFNLKNNEMIFPLTVKYLTPYKNEILTLLDSEDVLRNHVLHSINPDQVLDKDYRSIVKYLTHWDRDELSNREKKYQKVLRSIFEDENLFTFMDVLNKNFVILNPVSIAFSYYQYLTEDKRSVLFTPKYFNRLAEESISFLKSMKVSINKKTKRFVANRELQRIAKSTSSDGAIYLTYLEEPAKNSYFELPAEITSSIYLMKVLVENNDLARLALLFGKGSDFHALLTLEHIYNDIDHSSPAIMREKDLAYKIITGLRNRMLDNYFENIRQTFNSEISEQIIEILKVRS